MTAAEQPSSCVPATTAADFTSFMMPSRARKAIATPLMIRPAQRAFLGAAVVSIERDGFSVAVSMVCLLFECEPTWLCRHDDRQATAPTAQGTFCKLPPCPASRP